MSKKKKELVWFIVIYLILVGIANLVLYLAMKPTNDCMGYMIIIDMTAVYVLAILLGLLILPEGYVTMDPLPEQELSEEFQAFPFLPWAIKD